MLEPGSVVDRFVVEELIGEGGMAAVYRVRHREMDTVHALKVLTSENPDVRDRLLLEGRMQATLRHPNVVGVSDILDVEGRPALLMEYVRGPTLEQLMHDRKRLPVEEALQVFHGIVAGIDEAHAHGMVHRDLKPANILLAETANGLVPKVLDFGLAKGDFSGDGGRTRTGWTMGTPAYMAPEQVRNAKGVDHRADIFSLGCLLYEMVCGRPPFVGADVLAIMNAVVGGEYRPPRIYAPDLPDRVEKAIEGCLVVDRRKRIQNSHELLGVLGFAPPSDRPATVPPAGERMVVPAGGTALVAVGAGVLVFLVVVLGGLAVTTWW